LLDHLLDMRQRRGINLLVIDPLAPFLPTRNENAAAGMLDALAPLQRLAARGMAVLLAHHPRKGEPARRPGAAAPWPPRSISAWK
jgi:archaellum biogenesis ATPase FlaH